MTLGFFDLRRTSKVQPEPEPFNPYQHFVYRQIEPFGGKYVCDQCEQEREGIAYQGLNMTGMEARTLCPSCHALLSHKPQPEKLKPRKRTLD